MIMVRDTTGARGRDTTEAPITSVAKPHAWGAYYIASLLTPQSSPSKLPLKAARAPLRMKDCQHGVVQGHQSSNFVCCASDDVCGQWPFPPIRLKECRLELEAQVILAQRAEAWVPPIPVVQRDVRGAEDIISEEAIPESETGHVVDLSMEHLRDSWVLEERLQELGRTR